MEFLIYFILLALLAEIIGTVGGFGSSMLFVPIASYFFDFHSVLGITALFHLSSNISKIFFFREGFNKKLIIRMGFSAIVFVSIGAWLSKYITSDLLEKSLAIFLILISLTLLIFRNLKLNPTRTTAIIGGALSGFLAGILGTGGTIRGVVLASYHLKSSVFIATSAVIDLGIDASRSIVYMANGFVHQHDLYLIPILLVVSFIGTYIGKQILSLLTENQFKNSVLILILVTGVLTLSKGVFI
ncbi:sulfite exporter TauE/SafE family protein [Flavobacterium sp. 20NA77.7]|uniref:Probable membrane transporter protein n=1 Tax=Flavobacterium nakdongensis TaxID=3073563 RepID=A0ABY9REM6_9FLAO|nr:sulfite exporter TauE/SafE family protein [Flavobacterium sp. 20NA77.7]WMW78596.1 sulfite exporter TauE/SafE family protein [Flavobacterium sp. 20NA77.7]